MESITIKLEKDFIQDIEKVMKKKHYTTKTEFVREALRQKLSQEEKEELHQAVKNAIGASPHRTTDEDLHRARDIVFEKLEKEYEEKKKKAKLHS